MKKRSLARSLVRGALHSLDVTIQRALDQVFPQNLTARYIFGLGIIAGLAVTGQVVIQLSLTRQIDTQRCIRTLDREAPLLDALKRGALTVQLSSNPREAERRLGSLHLTLEQLKSTQDELWPAATEAFGSGALAALQNSMSRLSASEQRLAAEFARSPQGDRRLDVLVPLIKETVELAALHQEAVSSSLHALEQGLETQVDRFKRAELVLSLGTLLVLLLEALYVFRPAVARLYDALRIRSDFLSRMSHELRNPMNSIIGMANLLAETSISEQQRNYLSVLRRSGAGLLEMLNSLLDLSSLETGKLKLESTVFDLYEVLERCLDLVVVRAESNRTELIFELAPDVPLRVSGDPVRLQQILSNLLGNAVKFTEVGRVTLRVARDDGPDPDRLRFTIADTGIGIEKQKLATIFDPFVQADTTIRRRFGGSGLGLSIAKELVERMRGRLAVKSEQRVGSTFSFAIPLKGEPLSSYGARAKRAALPVREAVVLERYDPAYAVTAADLDALGIRARRAQSPEEALAAARENRADRVFLIDTETAQGHLSHFGIVARQNTAVRILFFVRNTAATPEIERLSTLGGCGLIFKPLKPVQLLDALTAAFRSPEAASAATAAQAAEPESARDTRKLRILVADDSPDNQALVQGYLGGLPYELMFADNGRDAVKRFESGRFDLVLMDIDMPEMDGYAATRAIRAFEARAAASRRTPVLGLSAYNISAKAAQLGFDGSLVKPITAPLLRDAIVEHTTAPQGAVAPVAPKGAPRLPSDTVAALEQRLASLGGAYLENRRKELGELKEKARKSDFPGIERLGHRMKGNALSFGFARLGELGGELEQAAREADLPAVESVLSRIEGFLADSAKPPAPPTA